MKKVLFPAFFLALILPIFSFASSSNGTIQAPNAWAWGNNAGWVNFVPEGGNIHVTDSGITGYAWDSIYGWINFAPEGSGVTNDGLGNLSGYAWSTGGGWINFSGVTINPSGKFIGIASGDNYGQLTFDCNQCSVITDWAPITVRPATVAASGGAGGNGPILKGKISSIINSIFPNDKPVGQVEQVAGVGEVTPPNPNINRPTYESYNDVSFSDVPDSYPEVATNENPAQPDSTFEIPVNTESVGGDTNNTTGTEAPGLTAPEASTPSMPLWTKILIAVPIILIIFAVFRMIFFRKKVDIGGI